MATDNLTEHFTEVADAIREKDGTTEPINPQDFAGRILAIPSSVYEVGDYLETESSTSPAERYGGTWEELPQGTFTMSAGEGNTAGQTGGSNSVTLKEENLPEHNHMGAQQEHLGEGEENFSAYAMSVGHLDVGATSYPAFTTSAGRGQPFDNRPQYRTTHKWRKVA